MYNKGGSILKEIDQKLQLVEERKNMIIDFYHDNNFFLYFDFGQEIANDTKINLFYEEIEQLLNIMVR